MGLFERLGRSPQLQHQPQPPVIPSEKQVYESLLSQLYPKGIPPEAYGALPLLQQLAADKHNKDEVRRHLQEFADGKHPNQEQIERDVEEFCASEARRDADRAEARKAVENSRPALVVPAPAAAAVSKETSQPEPEPEDELLALDRKILRQCSFNYYTPAHHIAQELHRGRSLIRMRLQFLAEGGYVLPHKAGARITGWKRLRRRLEMPDRPAPVVKHRISKPPGAQTLARVRKALEGEEFLRCSQIAMLAEVHESTVRGSIRLLKAQGVPVERHLFPSAHPGVGAPQVGHRIYTKKEGA